MREYLRDLIESAREQKKKANDPNNPNKKIDQVIFTGLCDVIRKRWADRHDYTFERERHDAWLEDRRGAR